jgi:O-antigen/teichoic acid export membrane protein
MEEKHIADIAIALYSLPMKIVEVGMMYGTIFLNSLLPVLTELIKKDDTKKIHTLTKHALKLLFIL